MPNLNVSPGRRSVGKTARQMAGAPGPGPEDAGDRPAPARGAEMAQEG